MITNVWMTVAAKDSSLYLICVILYRHQTEARALLSRDNDKLVL